MFTLKPLPYDLDALAPHMSRTTLEYHYGKHHRGYVDKLNDAIEGTRFQNEPLDAIVRETHDEGMYQNAAQTWNHEFFWHCLTPRASDTPPGRLVDALRAGFGSVDDFRKAFTDAALDRFGSGWAWLVKTSDERLRIVTTSNAGTPLRVGDTPLLTCDVWEHAYYIDHRNDRAAYLDAFWRLVNWEFVTRNLETRDPLASAERIVAVA